MATGTWHCIAVTFAIVIRGVSGTQLSKYLIENGPDDATWVLTSAFIILTMQSGFGLIESGCLPSKFAVNIMMKNVCDILLGGFAYWFLGYGFSHGVSWMGVIGMSDFFINEDHAIVLSTMETTMFPHFMFQYTFAATANTIVSGAVAGRMKFKVYLLFAFFNTLVYCVSAHWVLNHDGWLFKMGVLDFAGAGPVHIVGGTTSAVGAFMVGCRPDAFQANRARFSQSSAAKDNPANVIFGLFLLWWGWLGFNCGSTFGITGTKWLVASRSAVTTTLSSIGGGIAGILWSLALHKDIVEVNHVVHGILAGLVSITGICAFVLPVDSFIVGASGAVMVLSCSNRIEKFQLFDDPVGAATVHLVGGIWSLLCGAFCCRSGLIGGPSKPGLFFGGGLGLLGVQSLACVVLISWSAITTWMFLKSLDLLFGLRASDEMIEAGFDICEHGILAPSQEPNYEVLNELASLKTAFAELEKLMRQQDTVSELDSKNIDCNGDSMKSNISEGCCENDGYFWEDIPNAPQEVGADLAQIQPPYESRYRSGIPKKDTQVGAEILATHKQGNYT